MRHSFSGAVLRRVLLALALTWLIRKWVWMPVLIVGNSMEPALRHHQLAGVNKLAYLFRPPRRGDVVAAWTGQDLVIKRIEGLPDEEISHHDGVFYVNGSA